MMHLTEAQRSLQTEHVQAENKDFKKDLGKEEVTEDTGALAHLTAAFSGIPPMTVQNTEGEPSSWRAQQLAGLSGSRSVYPQAPSAVQAKPSPPLSGGAIRA